uniref:SfiI-subtelomeric related protein family member, putative n=1 Tax=Theileria annulata TaxID=5874 RepID=A0A3B0MEI1_THEAN
MCQWPKLSTISLDTIVCIIVLQYLSVLSTPLPNLDPSNSTQILESSGLSLLSTDLLGDSTILSSDQYQVTKIDDIIKIHFNDNSECTEIISSNKTLWKKSSRSNQVLVDTSSVDIQPPNDSIDYNHESTESSIPETSDTNPTSSFDSSSHSSPEYLVLNKSVALLTMYDKRIFVYKSGVEWRSFSDIVPKVVSFDVSKKDNSHICNYSKSDKIITYTTKHNYLINKVNCNSLSWEASDNTEYVFRIVLDKGSGFSRCNNITLHLLNGSILHGVKGNLDILDKKDKKSDHKLSEKNVCISLDVDIRKSTTQFQHILEHDISTYRRNENFKFTKIKQGKTVIWSSSENKINNSKLRSLADSKDSDNYDSESDVCDFSKKVMFDGINLSVYVDCDIKHFQKSGSTWKQSGNKISLDINQQKSDFFFTFDCTCNVKTYKCNQNFVIDRVIESKKFGSPNVIWDSSGTHKSISGYMVVIKANLMSLYLSNEVLHFLKFENEWTRRTSELPVEGAMLINENYLHKSVTLASSTISPMNVEKKLDILRLFLYTSGNHSYTLKNDENKYTYTFSDKSYCFAIKYELDVFWMHSSVIARNYNPYSTDPYPEKIVVQIVDRTVSIIFKDYILDYIQLKGSWRLKDQPDIEPEYLYGPPEEKLTLITLNLDSTINTPVSYHIHDYFHTYTPKYGHGIDKITQGGNIIWEGKNNESAIKVVMINHPSSDQYLSILITNGNNLLLYKSANDMSWKHYTHNTKRFFSKIKMFSYEESGLEHLRLDHNHFKPDLRGMLFGVRFKPGIRCISLTHKDMPMWTHSDDAEFGHPKGLYFDLLTNKFNLINSDDQIKVLEIPEKPLIKLILDINTTQSTSEFEYTDKDGLVTYTPKDGHVFSKLAMGSTVFWESKDDCGTKVIFIDENKKYVSILLQNDTFAFLKLSEYKTWIDLTSLRYDVSKLKLIGENDVLLKPSQRTVTIDDHSFHYLFHDGVKCRKIMYEDDEVWNHSDDTQFADIKSFSLNLISNRFFLNNLGNDVKELDFIPTSSPEFVSAVTKITLDIDNTQSSSEYDYTLALGVKKFASKTGFVFKRIESSGNLIWEPKDPSVHSVRVALNDTSEKPNEHFLSVVDNNGGFLLFQKSISDNSWNDVTDSRHCLSELRFITENGVEMSMNQYTICLYYFSYSFAFDKGYDCSQIIYEDKVIWNNEDHPKFGSIKEVYLHMIPNKVFLRNHDDKYKRLHIPDLFGISTPTPKKTDSEETQQSTSSGVTPKIVIQAPVTTDKKTIVQEHATGKMMSLDIGQKESGENFEVIKKDNIATFTAKFGYGFNVVTHNGIEIWKTDDIENYSFKVIIDGVSTFRSTKNISLYLAKGDLKQFYKSDVWMEKSSKLTVDLKKIENTNEYGFSTEDIFTTIFTKYSYSINKLVHDNKVVWESQNDCDTNKAVFVQSINEEKFLAILMSSDILVLLHRPLKNKTWEDITDTRNSISDLKAFKDDDTELDSSQYKLELNEFSYGIKFNYIVKCSRIMYKDKVIYNYDGNKDFEFLRGIYLYLSSNRFYIVGRENVTKLLGGEKDLITLDVNKKQSTIEYQFVEKTNFSTFTYRDSFLFNKITYDNKLVWESDSDKDYSYKVVLDSGSGSSSLKNITVHLVSGNVFHFYKADRFYEKTKWVNKSKTLILDIDKFEGTLDYEYEHDLDDDKRTYIPMIGNIFYKILSSEMLFWDSKNNTEFVNRVVVEGTDSHTNFVILYLENKTLRYFHKIDGAWTSKIVVTLDISIDDDGNSFTYVEDYQKNIEAYTPREQRLFNRVIRSHVIFGFFSPSVVWETEDPEEYATKVITDGFTYASKNNVSIYHSNGNITHLTYYRGKWLRKSDKIIVDIGLEESTIEFDYEKGFFKTYSAKPGYSIIKVIESDKSKFSWIGDFFSSCYDHFTCCLDIYSIRCNSGCVASFSCSSDCCKSDCCYFDCDSECFISESSESCEVFWHAKNYNEYATEIKIIPYKSSEYLLVFVYESKFVLFHKGGKHRDWTDITETRYNLANLKFYKQYNDSDYTLVDSSQYKITYKNTSYIYTFKDDVECDLIKYNDKIVYIFNEDIGYPERIQYDIYRNTFYSFFPDNKWFEFYIDEEVKLITLRLDQKESTDEVDYVSLDGVGIYIPKVGYRFNSITEHRISSWHFDLIELQCLGFNLLKCECFNAEDDDDDDDDDEEEDEGLYEWELFGDSLFSFKCFYFGFCNIEISDEMLYQKIYPKISGLNLFKFGCRRAVDQLVWETKDPFEHATKVLLDASEEDQQTLTIHMTDGTTQIFTREDKDDDWEKEDDDDDKSTDDESETDNDSDNDENSNSVKQNNEDDIVKNK